MAVVVTVIARIIHFRVHRIERESRRERDAEVTAPGARP